MKKHSVLIINRVYPPHNGATGRMAENLARYLLSKGYEVSVITTGEKSSNVLEKDILVNRVQANQKPASTLSYLIIYLKMMFKALTLKKHDIVVTLTDPPLCCSIGYIYSIFKKAKHVHWVHDIYPDLVPHLGKRIPQNIYKFLFSYSRKIMNKSARVIVIGRCMANYLVNNGISQNKITIIPNWADHQIFMPDEKNGFLPSKAKLPEKMFRDDSPKFRILYAGNIGLAHNIKIIIDAAKLLSEHKEIELVFVGTSKAHENLAQERSKEGLDNIKFIPYQPPQLLKNILESGDVHLVSQSYGTEGLLVPCKFYSALAVGRPTIFIGSEDTEIAKVIKEYKTGINVFDNSAQTLYDSILYYRNDGKAWFDAQEGAIKASGDYNAHISLSYWQEELEKVAALD